MLNPFLWGRTTRRTLGSRYSSDSHFWLAALARTFGWNGWWIATGGLLLAVSHPFRSLWVDVLLPARKAAAVKKIDKAHSTAVEVALTRDDDGVGVSVDNRGTHEVRHVNVIGFPVGERDVALVGPTFERTRTWHRRLK